MIAIPGNRGKVARILAAPALLAALLWAEGTIGAAAQDIRSVRVQFEQGAQSATVEGEITGREIIDYRVGARRGQVANISLGARTGSTYFNILPPGAETWEAVFVGSRDGRQFEGVLDASGDWSVRVYQMGNARDAGETHPFRLEIIIAANAGAGTGDTAYTGPESGGPRRWQVRAGSGLRMHDAPSVSAPVIATLADGSILSNLGCETAESRTWCDVQPFRGGARGYVAAEYLVPAPGAQGSATPMGEDDSALRAGQGAFDATGIVPCAQSRGQPMGQCQLGVARSGGGDATVVVTRPDGTQRVLFFTHGDFTGTDASEAGAGFDTDWRKESDLHLIRIDDERYEIPDAVIFGG